MLFHSYKELRFESFCLRRGIILSLYVTGLSSNVEVILVLANESKFMIILKRFLNFKGSNIFHSTVFNTTFFPPSNFRQTDPCHSRIVVFSAKCLEEIRFSAKSPG